VKITSREKRFLISGGSVCVLFLLWFLGAPLIPGLEDLSTTVDFKRRLLQRHKETLRQEESYDRRVERYQRRWEGNLSRLLGGDSASIAAAELQRLLSDIADQAGVDITRQNIQPEQRLENDIVKIAVDIQTNCNPEQLVELLTAVKNYDKLLTVDELTISQVRVRRRLEIRPNIKVSGYILLPEEAEAEEKPAGGR